MPLLLCMFIHAWIIPVGQLIGAIPRDHARFITCLNADDYFLVSTDKKGFSKLKFDSSSIIANLLHSFSLLVSQLSYPPKLFDWYTIRFYSWRQNLKENERAHDCCVVWPHVVWRAGWRFLWSIFFFAFDSGLLASRVRSHSNT